MKIGVLLCDDVPEDNQAQFGTYKTMFSASLLVADSSFTPVYYHANEGDLPKTVDECDAYLISGARESVFETHAWIPEAIHFVQKAANAGLPVIGICFGHQLLATAMGGRVERSAKGWGVGLASNQVHEDQNHIAAPNGHFTSLVFHQDQVVELPERIKVLASSDFCPYFVVGNGENLLGIQGHPEFETDFCKARIKARTDTYGEERAEQAFASLKSAPDNALMWAWIVDIIKKPANICTNL